MDLTDKVAIVTGGGGRSGLAVSRRLVSAGALVVIADVDALAGAMAADELDALGHVHFIDTDIACEPSARAVVERTITAHHGVDLLVNCASFDRRAPLTELPTAEWRRVLEVNLTGPYLFAKYCAEPLRQRRGAIVNVISSRPLAGDRHCEAYAASKAGLVGLTQSLALSLAPEVRVNCVSSAWDVAEFAADAAGSAAGAVVEADDIAATVLRLCADADGVASGRHVMLNAA